MSRVAILPHLWWQQGTQAEALPVLPYTFAEQGAPCDIAADILSLRFCD
jgi:hypothetical protein